MLEIGPTDVTTAFVSMSARHPDGDDAAYLAWHGLDHAPEQRRLPSLRGALRFVSTPACRNARAAGTDRYDEVDHVMTYLFAGRGDLEAFGALGRALAAAGRMPMRLPSVALGTFDLVDKAAAPRVLAGADVVPWRPCTGLYLLIEGGPAPTEHLVEVPGVAGAWSFAGPDASGEVVQLTYCFLDDEPLEVADALSRTVVERRAAQGTELLLAAPFLPVVPFEWTRHLP